MKHRESIKNIMTTEVKTVHRRQNMAEVQKMMESYQIRHVPVVESEKVIGMISRTDLMHVRYGAMKGKEASQTALLETMPVEEVMTETPMTVPVGVSIREAGRLLHEKDFSALPVTDEDEKLVGIVTTKDMVGYLLEQY